MDSMQPDPQSSVDSLVHPPFKIVIRNRAAKDATVAVYEAYQVPAAGDVIVARGGRHTDGTPFEGWELWQVDRVVWTVSDEDSAAAHKWADRHGTRRGKGCCQHVELLVWPAQEPHWSQTPPWSQVPWLSVEGDGDTHAA